MKLTKSRRELMSGSLVKVLLKSGVVLSLLAVAACVDGVELAVRQQRMASQEISKALSEFGEAVVTMRFVAFGDVDNDDNTPLGMVPDAQIAAIKGYDVSDWWASVIADEELVADEDSDIRYYVPPGVQIVASSGRIYNAPAAFLTTRSEGTIELTFTISKLAELEYMVCVISPVDEDLIAGCSGIEKLWHHVDGFTATLYIYFSNGRAYIDSDSGRYQRFLDGTLTSGYDSNATATVKFVSTQDLSSDTEQLPLILGRNQSVAVIKDADIGSWWDKISNSGERLLALDEYGRNRFITLDSEILEPPIDIVTTGDNAIAEIGLEPGNYLFCGLTGTDIVIFSCDYENIVASQDYVYGIHYSYFHAKLLSSRMVREPNDYISYLLNEKGAQIR